MHKKGFTLVELAVIAAIIIFVSASSYTWAGNFVARRQLESQAFQLVQDLRYVQQMAITHRQDFSIKFYTTLNEYKFEKESGAINANKASRVVKRELRSNLGFPMFFGKTTPVSVSFGTSSSPPTSIVTLTFTGTGAPTPGGGEINLIGRGKNRIKIEISVAIGRIRMEWVD